MKGNYEIVCRGCGETSTLVGVGVGRREYCGAECRKMSALAAMRVSQRRRRQAVVLRLERLEILERLVGGQA